MRTNPFYDAWLFLIGSTGDHQNTGVGLLLTLLFLSNIWLGLYQSTDEWPWQYVFLIFVQGFFVVTNAGRSLGLDASLARTPLRPFAGNGALARLYRALA